jgi:hypothetical protein
VCCSGEMATRQNANPASSSSTAANVSNLPKTVGSSAANLPAVAMPPYEEAWASPSQQSQGIVTNGPLNNGAVPTDVPVVASDGRYVNVNGMINNRDALNEASALLANSASNVQDSSEKVCETAANAQVQSNSTYLSSAAEPTVAAAVNKALASGLNSSDGPMNIVVPKPSEQRKQVGNYEEPWDLVNMQEKLEEKLRLAAAAKGGVIPVPQLSANQSDVSSTAASPASVPPVTVSAVSSGSSAALASSGALPTGGVAASATGATMAPPDARSMEGYDKPWDWKPHKKDDRAQEGYDKPWDWKPHKKDDRAQEGYDKPWDWKPHKKDDRPATEYDQPWDQRAKGIEKEILKAKGPSVGGANVRGGVDVPPSVSSAAAAVAPRGRKENDIRPVEEYDTPWDQKAKKLSSDSPSKVPSAAVPSASLSPGLPSQPALSSGAMFSPVTERIDVTRPLEQQG